MPRPPKKGQDPGPDPKRQSSKGTAPRTLKMDGSGLNYQRRLFVIYYVGKANGNATLAAKMAGYASPKSAGSRLLTFVDVARGVQAQLNESALSTDEILSRLSDISTASLGDFLRIDAKGCHHLDLGKAVRLGKLHCLKSIKQTQYGVWIELHDQMAALDKLARYRSLYAEKAIDEHADDVPLDPEAAKRALQAAAGAFGDAVILQLGSNGDGLDA